MAGKFARGRNRLLGTRVADEYLAGNIFLCLDGRYRFGEQSVWCVEGWYQVGWV